MNIDIKAKEIKPVRHTYSHVARRLGGDKPASRYQEGTYDVQATENFHYRPTWQPDKELYDPTRTAIVMEDWYKFLDPRQYYYGNYCMARAKQQDSADQNFKFVEKRGLLDLLPDDIKASIQSHVIPLRHYEWGANMNNFQICAMGYGTAITAPASFHAADHLGNAQYITRIGLVLAENDTAVIDAAKTSWMEGAEWQGLRRLVENSLVVEDWFELYVAQNLAMDGLLHPLVFDRYEKQLASQGGASYSMLTEFIVDWFTESRRWIDKQISIACAESDANKALVSGWYKQWRDDAQEALEPLADAMLAENGKAVMAELVEAMNARAEKAGIEV